MQKQLFDSMQTALLVLNGRLEVYDLNASAEVLFGISDKRVRGLHIRNLWPGASEVIGEIEAVLESGHVYTHRQASLELATGNTITIDYTATPITGLTRSRVLLEIVPRDRFDRIDREEDRIAQYETSRVLIRGLAHEIKNPLGGLRGAAQLLEREVSQPELHEYTRIIVQEADRLRNLVDTMLGPREPPAFAPVNIHEVLERVGALIRAEAGERIRIVRDYDPSIPELSGDAAQLIQALLNICRNAMQAFGEQAGDAPPTITLKTRPVRRHTIAGQIHRLVCRLDIIDNGPGISPELMERIFYPMISGRADGSGLGLSISQSIIHQHGGLVECASRPGQTQFTLMIPLEQEK